MKWLLVLGSGAVCAFALGCSSSDEPAATPVPSETVSAPPSAQPSPANNAFQAAAPVLQRSMLVPGETLPGDNSVGFIDPAPGALELWRAAPGVVIPFLQPSRDGALLVSQVSADEWYVTERATGSNWRLRSELRPNIGVGYGTVLGAFTNINRGRLVLLDFAAGTVREVDYVRPDLITYSIASSADGRTIVIGDGANFVLVDLPANAVTPLAGTFANVRAKPLLYDRGFVLAPSLPATGEAFTFGWDGQRLSGSLADLSGLSPDGKLRVKQGSLGRIALAEGLGDLPLLDYFVIEHADGTPIGRMLGADFRGWSADGKYLLFGDRGTEPAIITVTGERVAVPGGANDFGMFAPDVPELVATYHGVANLETGARFEYTPPPGASAGTYWAAGTGTLVLRAGPIPGKGGGSTRQLFEPRFDGAPFSAEVGLTVVGAACAPVLGNQQIPATQLACLPAGTPLKIELVSPPAMGIEPLFFAGSRETLEETWLHVRAEDGVTGWIDAARLTWAP